MTAESYKYKVDMIKIVGFASIAPFGRAITDPYLFRDFDLVIVTAYILYTFVLLIFGAGLLLQGYVILNSKR